MKRVLIPLTLLAIVLLTFAASAAGAPATFVVTDVSLTTCNGPLIEGRLRLLAYDDGGGLVNGSSAVGTTVNAVHSNGSAAPVGWNFIASDVYQFAFSVGSADVTSISITIISNTDSSVVSPTVTIGCDGSVKISGGSVGPDNRLNRDNCDLTSALYATGLGIEVWDIQVDSTGEYKGAYTSADIAEFADAPPKENTYIGAIGLTTLEVLTTGEIQIKIAPDAEGKGCAVILDGIPPTSVYFR